MTAKEYKLICRLIDARVTVKSYDNGYYGSYDEKMILDKDIKNLKEDIAILIGDDNGQDT